MNQIRNKPCSILQVNNLTAYYGIVKAISNVTFQVPQGEIVALIGPNGAGKSTTLKAVCGLLKSTGGQITQGEILFNGRSIKGYRTDELVSKGISLVPEGKRIFPSMTVLENLEIGAYIRRDKKSIKDDMDKVLVMFPQLKHRAKQIAGLLSTGEQQMLAIGRALMLKPLLLLADEPSFGLSPNFVELIFDKLTEINKTGTSVLLVEQNVRMALDICHRGYVFEIGSIFLEGDKETLMNSVAIKEALLGNRERL